MSLWGAAKLLSIPCILLIVTCYCTVTVAQMPVDCCLTVRNTTIPKRLVADYKEQIAGEGCSRSAMILLTRRNFALCVPLDELWVQGVVKHVDSVRRHCKKNKYKGKRCNGVKA